MLFLKIQYNNKGLNSNSMFTALTRKKRSYIHLMDGSAYFRGASATEQNYTKLLNKFIFTFNNFFSAQQCCSTHQWEIPSDVTPVADCFVVTAAIMWLNLSPCEIYSISL